DALDGALAEAGRILGHLLLERVARERGEHGAAAGQDPEQRAEDRAAQRRLPRIDEIARARPQVAHARADGGALGVALLEIADDLDDAEQADDQRQEIDAVP